MKKIFKTIDGSELVVVNKKSAVIFELQNFKDEGQYEFELVFNDEIFKNLLDYIEDIAKKTWGNFTPREAYSCN